MNGSCSCGPNNQFCPSTGGDHGRGVGGPGSVVSSILLRVVVVAGRGHRIYEIIGGAVGGGILLLLGMCVFLYCLRKKAEKLRPAEVSIHKLEGTFPSSSTGTF
jgi:hypothetical protein